MGEKWKDLAWALFAGVHSDADTLRMITDIELKHPDDLSEQIQARVVQLIGKYANHNSNPAFSALTLFSQASGRAYGL